MNGKLHRSLFDLYLKIHRILFWTCSHCDEQVQNYLMNGTPVDCCSMCLTKKPEISLEEDKIVRQCNQCHKQDPVEVGDRCGFCGWMQT
jgi:hypothetical protein